MWWQCSFEWTSTVHKDRLKRQGLLQDGDVSAHGISQASGCGRNVDAGSSGPSFNMQKCIFKTWLCLDMLFSGYFLFSVTQWLFCNVTTACVVGCKVCRLGRCLLISATFSPPLVSATSLLPVCGLSLSAAAAVMFILSATPPPRCTGTCDTHRPF